MGEKQAIVVDCKIYNKIYKMQAKLISTRCKTIKGHGERQIVNDNKNYFD